MEKQLVSKRRVVDHGEVLTRESEVNAMLDLVRQETERIESRFLEPACGTGNFLTEVLNRKLRIVESRYGKNQLEYERNAALAISSIYGVDILQDNIFQCRKRLFEIFDQKYTILFKNKAMDKCREAVRYIIERNIIHGDALTLTTMEEKTQPIVFSEWSVVYGSKFKRRDFTLRNLVEDDHRDLPLFSEKGEEVFIPRPKKDYPLTHFLEVADVDN